MIGLARYFNATWLVAAVVVALASCAEKKPIGILTREEMVQIMEEMYVAEEKINNMAISRDSSKKVFEAMGAKVFERAAVSDTVFKKSFDYYMEHPRQMEFIYTALVDSLQLREQRAPFSTNPQ